MTRDGIAVVEMMMIACVEVDPAVVASRAEMRPSGCIASMLGEFVIGNAEEFVGCGECDHPRRIVARSPSVLEACSSMVLIAAVNRVLRGSYVMFQRSD
jgi:hypothetical protein